MTGKLGRVLLIEDHAETARASAMLLRRDGFEVATAQSIAEALVLCASEAFDLLVCDIELPDGDGLDVLPAARKTSPNIAGLVVSGHSDAQHRAAALQAGFGAYLVKPLGYEKLRGAIERAMATVVRPAASQVKSSDPP